MQCGQNSLHFYIFISIQEQSPGNLTEAVLSSFEKNQTYECFDLTKPQLTCHNASLGNLSVTVFSFSLLLLERQLLATQNLPMSSFSVVSIGPPPATVSTSTTATATTPEAEGQEQGKYNYIIAAVSALAVVSVLGIFIVCVVLFNKTRKKRQRTCYSPSILPAIHANLYYTEGIPSYECCYCLFTDLTREASCRGTAHHHHQVYEPYTNRLERKISEYMAGHKPDPSCAYTLHFFFVLLICNQLRTYIEIHCT